MAKYYGVTRSSEYLAHYGVKGMKWGVKKAIDSGDRAALSYHYAKAQKKLKKLTERASTGKGIAARRMAAGAAGSAVLSGVGTYALNRIRGVDPLNSAKTAGLAALAGGAGGAVFNAGRATSFEKARARQKRDEWKREMDRTFKGTGVVKAAKARKSLPNRLGPNSNRIGKDEASGVHYVDLRTKKRRKKQYS